MLDIDAGEKKTAMLHTARDLAQRLATRINGPVALYDSGRGFWLVGLKALTPEEWRSDYLWAKAIGAPFDAIHVEASMKWGRTTLRVSTKGNGHSIRRLGIFGS
jgi:hypothetical protein